MSLKKSLIFLSLITLVGCTPSPKSTSERVLPRLEKRGSVTQLIVDGEPFLVLGGELHNSSSSNAEYMRPVWTKIKSMGLNTALAAISWEQVEPQEGKFDFSTVDSLLSGAQANDMRVVILWFGSWKNGITSYVPQWVKRDSVRFPLAVTKDGYSLPILSTVAGENCEADAKAYKALMNYVKENDKNGRVIMMQIENEVGMHSSAMDYRPEAQKLFAEAVPSELTEYLVNNRVNLHPLLKKAWDAAGNKTSGNWSDIFGDNDYAKEAFMAWNYAKYMNTLAVAGKEIYAIPTFVNAWIVQPEDKTPGDYPSGGPQSHVHDIYRAAAPEIDMLTPDVYLADYPTIINDYSRNGNPVFVPESKAGVAGAANAFYTIGEMGGIGYSPFGIEGVMKGKETIKSGNSPTESTVLEAESLPFIAAYNVLESASKEILKHQAAGTIRGIWLKEENPAVPEQKVRLGNYDIKFELRKTRGSSVVPPLGYAIVMQTSADEYTVIGADVDVTFYPVDTTFRAGLGIVTEGRYENDQWIEGRWLNGDEVQLRYDLLQAAKEGQSGAGLRFRGEMPTIQKVQLYNYK